MKKLKERLLKKKHWGHGEKEPVKAGPIPPFSNAPSKETSQSATPPLSEKPEKEKYGLFPLSEANSSQEFPVDIIAVHGLNGNAFTTWTHPDTKTLWLRDLLPNALPGCRVYTFGYPADLFFNQSRANIRDYARRLLTDLRGLQNGWIKEKANRAFIFVCHSLGGIVFKQALVYAHEDDKAYSEIVKCIAGVVFLGTPQRGSNVATFSAVAAKVINACAALNPLIKSDLLDHLSLDSTALQDLTLSARNRFLDMKVWSFYETKPLSVPPLDFIVVEQRSATLAYPNEEINPLWEDHRSLCRFAGKDADSYKTVFLSIQSIAAEFQAKLRAQEQLIDKMRASVHSSLRTLDDYEKTCVELFRPFDMADYQNSLTKAEDSTCNWILNHPVFVSWLEKADSALLWLRGHPGCGKTVLSSYLAGHFEKEESPYAPKSVFVYYCDDKITNQKNANGVLLGLIYQVICRHRSLIQYVKRVFEVQGQNLVRSFSALWRICMRIMSDPKCGPTTWVIIDALDECEEGTRRILLDSIHAFLSDSSAGTSTQTRVKFILTSRPSITVGPEIETSSYQVTNYRISIDENQEGYVKGLHAFIHQRVTEISQRLNFPVDMKKFLEESLLNQAGETFLWVHIMLATLESSPFVSRETLHDLFAKIPPDLETTYLGFLSSLPPDHQSAATKFLLLILGTSKPLTLEELNVAFSVRDTHNTLEDVTAASQTSIQHTLQRLLGPLVKTSVNGVSLVHQSLKDFLLQGRLVEKAPPVMRQISQTSAALSIATACICYLQVHDFSRALFSPADESPLDSPISSDMSSEQHAGSPDRSSDAGGMDPFGFDAMFKEPEVLIADTCKAITEKYTLFEYASLHWAEHYAHSEAMAPIELKDAAQSLLDISTPNGANWWQFFAADLEHERQYKYIPKDPSLLTLAAFFNLSSVVKEELGQDARLPSATVNAALFWASHEGHGSVVEMLLKGGADPNAQHDLNGHTAVTIASRNGQLSCVVALLRDQRTNINMPGEKGKTALSLAYSNQHPDIVRELLRNPKCDASVPDVSGATALHWACRVADDMDVKALYKHPTVSLNHQDKNGRTAISWAAEHGVDAAVKALLKLTSADPNLPDDHGRSPLSWAAGTGRTSTVKLLLNSSKVNKSTADHDGRNPYSWAAGNGQADVLRTLFKYKCPGVDDPDVDAWAPLAWATHNLSPGTAEALVATGAVDLERRDMGGRTALAWAVEYGYLEVVKVLLRAGADPSSAAGSGATPLSRAQGKQGWEGILRELLRFSGGKAEEEGVKEENGKGKGKENGKGEAEKGRKGK